MHFKTNYFFYIILIFLLLAIGASYYRFAVILDYRVLYEADCNPEINSCFVGCEDDLCEYYYYYNYVESNARVLSEVCGENASMCDTSILCDIEGSDCVITYCDKNDLSNECYTQ